MKHALRQLHYAKNGEPVHVTPGVLAEEAYGVKTTSRDMIKFIEANIDPSGLGRTLQSAIGGPSHFVGARPRRRCSKPTVTTVGLRKREQQLRGAA